jgi:putative addiction module component (TIGR02574 family)
VGTIDIANLSSEERLRLLEEIWESLSKTPEAIALTTAQREELDRRLDGWISRGAAGITRDDVLKRIRSRTL